MWDTNLQNNNNKKKKPGSARTIFKSALIEAGKAGILIRETSNQYTLEIAKKNREITYEDNALTNMFVDKFFFF